MEKLHKTGSLLTFKSKLSGRQFFLARILFISRNPNNFVHFSGRIDVFTYLLLKIPHLKTESVWAIQFLVKNRNIKIIRGLRVQISVMAKFDCNQKPNLIHCAEAEAGCRRSHFLKEGTKQKTTAIAVNCTLFKEDRHFLLPYEK